MKCSMPLYEYQCDACGERFERIQKYSDALISVCPASTARSKCKPTASAAGDARSSASAGSVQAPDAARGETSCGGTTDTVEKTVVTAR